MDIITLYIILPLLLGWLMDLSLGDPEHLPHPIVWFGKLITWGDKRLNQQSNRLIKGGLYSTFLILFVFALTWGILLLANRIHPLLAITINTLGIFFFLAGKTLRREVKLVFDAVDQSVEDGRKQLSRIVGRDTSQLSPQQIRIGALETLAENLSDGVIAPLFWFLIFGLPGMAAYKMINTLDSMIAYKNDKYKDFGCWAAHIDDIANYIPARLTAILMLLVSGNLKKYSFVRKYCKLHLSPNSGYPESALAGILDCRFGGPNIYYGKVVDKPYIGDNPRELTLQDAQKAIRVNLYTEALMVILLIAVFIVL